MTDEDVLKARKLLEVGLLEGAKAAFLARPPAQGSGGRKDDQEKIRLELLDSEWLLGVGAVLTFGARKYAADNWRGGIQIRRLTGAALRHLLAFQGGEDLDPESSLSHLYHASCCLMFASWMITHRPDLDDRYRAEKAQAP